MAMMTTANFLDISDTPIIQMISDRNERAISFIVPLSLLASTSECIKRVSMESREVMRDINELSFNRNN